MSQPDRTPHAATARYRAVFTPAGWQVIDTVESCDPLAEFGTGSGEYRRAKAEATRLNEGRCERCGTFRVFGNCGLRQEDCVRISAGAS